MAGKPVTARAKVAVAFAAVWVIVASVSLAACGSEQPTEDSTRLDAIESRLDGQQQRLTAAEAAAAGAVAVQQESAVEIHRQYGSQRERLGWLEDRAMKLENRMAELERTVEYSRGQLQAELQAGFAEVFRELGLDELAEQVLGGLAVETEQGPEPPLQSFGDGTWLVGAEIMPGTYRSPADPAAACYMARLSGLSGSDADIIMSHEGADHDHDHVVVIEPTDVAFQASGCGTWTREE